MGRGSERAAVHTQQNTQVKQYVSDRSTYLRCLLLLLHFLYDFDAYKEFSVAPGLVSASLQTL